jgi:hypothetical protein
MPESRSIAVRPICAFEDETVVIRWQLADGRVYWERRTVPPRATREAKPRQLQDAPTTVDGD